MPVTDDLAAFRKQVHGCYAVAFADMSTEMVLATDAIDPLGQEVWDQIAAFARAQLGANAAQDGAVAVGGQALTYAILTDQDETCVIVRSRLDSDFVICGLTAIAADIAQFLNAGQDLVDRLAANA